MCAKVQYSLHKLALKAAPSWQLPRCRVDKGNVKPVETSVTLYNVVGSPSKIISIPIVNEQTLTFINDKPLTPMGEKKVRSANVLNVY